MVDSIDGGGSISPHDKSLYKQDFSKAVDLFQQSLQAYEQSKIPAQKEEYKDVMDKCLQVIKETAREAIRQEAQKQVNQMNKDYQNFISNDTPATYKQLNNDLNALKKP
jgi:hypothetical protein